MRGMSMILMMTLHVLAYYKDLPIPYAIWEFSQISVPLFIFCSAYLFYTRDAARGVYGLAYFKKRFIRLIKPYYLFLAAYLGVLLPLFEMSKMTRSYMLGSIFLFDGVYINWLVLLFLYLSVLSPLLMWLYKKARPVFGVWIFAAALFAAYTFTISWPTWWRWGMWSGWSLLTVYSWYVSRLIVRHQHRRIWTVATVSTLSFGMLWLIRHQMGISVEVTASKYPPNIYYLAYAAMVVPISWYVANLPLFARSSPKAITLYFSRHSYPLFFIHFFVIFFLLYVWPPQSTHWALYLVCVFALTFALQQTVTRLSKIPVFRALR